MMTLPTTLTVLQLYDVVIHNTYHVVNYNASVVTFCVVVYHDASDVGFRCGVPEHFSTLYNDVGYYNVNFSVVKSDVVSRSRLGLDPNIVY